MHQPHHHHHGFHYFPHGDNLMTPSLHLLHSRCQPICSSAILTIWVSASIQCSIFCSWFWLHSARDSAEMSCTGYWWGRALFYYLSSTGNKLALWLIVGAVVHSSLMGCWRVLSGFAQWADAWFTIYMPAPHSQRWGVRGFSYTDRGEGQGNSYMVSRWGGGAEVEVGRKYTSGLWGVTFPPSSTLPPDPH